MSSAILYGCANPDCGYRTLASTMGTPYTACPLCGGAWMIDPPIANRDGTGQVIVERRQGGKTERHYVVRPHLQASFDAIAKENL